MTHDSPQLPDDPVPAALVSGLKQAFGPPAPAANWASRDARVMAAFGARRGWRWGWIGGALAASVALAAGIGVWRMESRPADYVRTGDIRDAYYVARAVAAGKSIDKQWDANADGRVDDGDVRTLAMLAVRVR
jgi:hypothetical protein